jgi:tetratricopeptide (TPR) repeat protein
VLLVSLLLPGMLMTLAIENSMTQALNPVALVRLALSIGWPYFLTVGLFLLLNGGAGTVMGLFGQALPAGARAFLGGLSQHYFWFVNMHLLGYLVYQYHERVGFSPDALAEQDDGWGDVLAPVEEHIEAGQYEAAADRLKAMLPEYPDHAIWLRQKRHTVLKLTERTNQLLDNGGKLLAALVDANRMREATEVYIDLTDIDPGVRPGRETDYEPLLDMLVQRGEYQRAVRMANGFHKDFPGSQSIPPLYLQVARIFLEFLDQPAKARQIAEFLIRRFPDHPAATRARALRDAVTT